MLEGIIKKMILMWSIIIIIVALIDLIRIQWNYLT